MFAIIYLKQYATGTYAPDQLIVETFATEQEALTRAAEIPNGARVFRKGAGYRTGPILVAEVAA